VATRAQKAKVSVFLLASAALFVATFIYLQGLQGGTKSSYFTIFEESVLGLSEGGTVEYLGVPVGSVTGIQVLPGNQVRVDYEVEDRQISLHKGVEASLVLYSIATGTLYVSLSGGAKDAPVLPDGTQIPAKPSLFAEFRPQLETAVANVVEIGENLSRSLEGLEDGQITRLLNEAEGTLADARGLLQNTNETVTSVRGDVEEGIEDLRGIVDEVKAFSESATSTAEELDRQLAELELAETEEQLRDALEEYTELARSVNETVAGLEQTVRAVQHDVDTIQYAFQQGLTSLQETFAALGLLAQQLQEDPSSLLRGRGKPQEIEE